MTNLIKKIKLLSTQKKLVLLLLPISIISLIFILNRSKKNDGEQTTSPTESPISSGKEIPSLPQRPDSAQAYQLNRFDSLENIINYSWFKNRIVYTTKNGIYYLWNNTQEINSNIDYSYFNSSGKVIYSNNNNFYLYDFESKTNSLLGNNLFNAQISNSGKHMLYQNGGFLNIKKLDTNLISTKILPNVQNFEYGFVKNTDNVYVYNSEKNIVEIFDLNFKLLNTFNIEQNGKFIETNTQSNIVMYQLDDQIKLISSEKNILTFTFNPDVNLSATWIGEDKAIVIEKRKRGSLELYDDYLWMIDTNGKKSFIINSYPIKNKINLDIKPTINSAKNALIVTENNGKIWIVSLLVSQIPIYSEQGLGFYRITTNYNNTH